MPHDQKEKDNQACNGGSRGSISSPTSQANELVLETMLFWKNRSGADVSEEDASEMIDNLSGLFSLLHEWDLKENSLDTDRINT